MEDRRGMQSLNKPVTEVNQSDIKAQIADSIAVKNQLLSDTDTINAIDRAAALITEAYRRGNKTMFGGNGGSAADAQHLAGELVNKFYFDRKGLPSLSLSTDTSIMTAISNDYGYETLFARQIEAHGKPGDVFIGISTSGNSRNIVNALDTCRQMGIHTVALTGTKNCKMDEADIVIKVPSDITPRIQECHTLIGHIICCIVEDNIFNCGDNHPA